MCCIVSLNIISFLDQGSGGVQYAIFSGKTIYNEKFLIKDTSDIVYTCILCFTAKKKIYINNSKKLS